jgi:hypothetical protein
MKEKNRRMKQPDAQKQECSSPSLLPSLRCYTFAFLVVLVLRLIVIGNDTFAQVPVINTPQPATMQPNVNVGFPNQNPNYGTTQSNTNNQLDIYEQDKRQLEQQNAALYEQLYGEKAFSSSIQYSLPSYSSIPTTSYFHQALDKLNNMLTGKEPMSLKMAVFIVENAYLEGRLDFNKYNTEIQNIIQVAKLKAIQDGYDWKNPLTRNMMLFKAMCDTIKLKDPSHEGYITSYPMRYDFDDFLGKQNYSKMLVAKLLATKSGQCHSLPLAFLICTEETNTKAYLSFSPSHSYVKFKDPMNNWYNLELTSGRVVSDAFITRSGFVKSEALKSHIYTDTLDLKQTIAYCVTDLAKEYARKYGYDEFVNQCVDTALKYYPNNIYGLQIKSDYYSLLFDYVLKQTEHPRPEILKAKYPKAYEILMQRNKLYETIDNMGFSEMPEEAYKDWLQSVNEEKEKQEQQGNMLRLTRTIK